MVIFFIRIRKVKKMKKLVPHEGTSISGNSGKWTGLSSYFKRVINSFHFLKRISDQL